LLVILLTGSLNLTSIIEAQKAVYFILPLFPLFIVFFIGCIAETNRAPFDLAEAESELVSGFMTEHSAVIFVFFFLAEYASIVLICILTSILFLGGYLDFLPLKVLIYIFDLFTNYDIGYNYIFSDFLIYGTYSSLNLAFKTSILIFVFI
jgi:NADH-ubiquinone oxidoreductase chain 1